MVEPLDRVQGRLHEALGRVGTGAPSALLRTIFTVDADDRLARHGMAGEIDRSALRAVAGQMLVNGYGHQARRLLAVPGALSLLGDEVGRLLRQASPAERTIGGA